MLSTKIITEMNCGAYFSRWTVREGLTSCLALLVSRFIHAKMGFEFQPCWSAGTSQWESSSQLQQRSVVSLCRTAGSGESGEDIYPEIIKGLFHSAFPLVFFSCFGIKNKNLGLVCTYRLVLILIEV